MRKTGALALLVCAGCSFASGRTPVLPATAVSSFEPAVKRGYSIVVRVPDASRTRGVVVVALQRAGAMRVGKIVGSVAPGAPGCTNESGGRLCRFTMRIARPVGTKFEIQTYDRAPKNGAIPAGAHEIAEAAAYRPVGEDAPSLRFDVSGVLASLAVHVPLPIHAIDPATFDVIVEGRDSSGGVVVSGRYVDAAGKKVSVAMGADARAGTTVSFSPQSIVGSRFGVTASYDASQATQAQVKSGFVSVLSATPNVADVVAGSNDLEVVAPVFTSYTVPSPKSYPWGLARGAAGDDLWFTESAASNVARLLVSPNPSAAPAFTEYPIDRNAAYPTAIAYGPDGAWWYTERDAIGRMVPGKKPQSFYRGIVANSNLLGIASGSDGAMWFTECYVSKVGRIAAPAAGRPRPQIVQYDVTGANLGHPRAIISAADGGLWFTADQGSRGALAHISASGAVAVARVSLPTHPSGMVADASGRIWMSSSYGLAYFDPSGNEGKFIGGYSGKGPIAIGPDRALWFVALIDRRGHQLGIVRYGPDRRFVRFAIPGTSGDVYAILTGPDGALWYADADRNTVVRFQ